jgi:hypothetical protein
VESKWWLDVSLRHAAPCATSAADALPDWLSLHGLTDSVRWLARDWLSPRGDAIDDLLAELVSGEERTEIERSNEALASLVEDLHALLALDDAEPWRRHEFARWFQARADVPRAVRRRLAAWSPDEPLFPMEAGEHHGGVRRLLAFIEGHAACHGATLLLRKGWGW